MYDTVKYKAKCWRCDFVIGDDKEWQTKDGQCMMERLTPKQLGTGMFYSICPKCYAWNEYEVITKEVEIVFLAKESKQKTNED